MNEARPARRALGLADIERSPVTLEAECLAACAGLFQFEIGPLKLKPDAGALTGSWPIPGSRFRPVAVDTFFLETDPEVTLRFQDPAGGVYQRLVIEGYAEPASGTRSVEASAEAVA